MFSSSSSDGTSLTDEPELDVPPREFPLWDTAHEKDSIIPVSSLDPCALELYRNFKSTGRIDYYIDSKYLNEHSNYIWQGCWSLMNAYIFGVILTDTGFADRIMDILAGTIAPGIPADIDTIWHVFKTEDMPDQLQQFVVDRCLDASAE